MFPSPTPTARTWVAWLPITWLNVDLLWAVAVVAAGVATLFT